MRNRLSDEQGFTLIELLVVILIIGILAAIALPNFIGQRSRAQDASAKTNARNAVSMVEACYTDNQDYGLCKTTAQLGTNTGINFVTSTPAAEGQTQVVADSTKPDEYTIKSFSKSGTTFSISKDAAGNISRDCDKVQGACPASKKW